MAKTENKDTKKIAAELGLVDIDTQDAIDRISQDILLAMYSKNGLKEEMKDRIRKTYVAWNPGSTWEDDNEKVLSILLLGPPGQGKTTAFKMASRKVSEALELNYIENPSDEYKVKENDFMFVSQEFSAENSKVTLGGIPAKTEEEGIEYMTNLVNKRLAMLRKAGGGLLLLDDFPNASPNIQNVGLSLTDEKRFQGLNLQGTYVGLTGNLGAIDGTHTTRLSTALRGRCQIYFTEDKRANFVNRLQSKYRDEMGDLGMSGFLQRFEQHFATMPNTRQSGGFPSPRTWDHFITEARREVRRNGGRGRGEMKALPKIQKLASSLLGLEVGQEVHSYIHSMMKSADPLARAMILEGKLNKEELQKRFKDGFSADEQHFAYQYALALSDYTVQKIVKDGKMDEAMSRFATGIIPLNLDVFTFALDHMKAKLANQMEEYSQKQGQTGRVLTTETKKKILNVVAATPQFTQAHKDAMIDALTDATKYDSGTRRSRRGTAGA